MEEVYKFVCPKCNWTTDGVENTTEMCNFCHTEMIQTKYTSDEFFSRDIMRDSDLPPLKPIIFDEYVKDNPLYDPEKEKEKEDWLFDIIHSSTTSTIKCPTCGSTNVRHISALNRAASIGIFGIFSGKIGKNYECLNCKAKW